ncbi:nitronate monooxygenase [Salinisphaera sp. C84B14]|uniref:NAD(P)H-dependent flavin oxidoreductase n=1 Tax=Salinisphaera sp. C84B14 TaxID=1304155 RepID=UPI003342256A
MLTNNSTFAELFGAKTPIFQAPMAGVATPQLAAAVSEAGAVGGLGLGSSSVEKAEKAIAETQELTSKPFNVNFFCHRPAACLEQTRQEWISKLSEHFRNNNAAPPTSLTEGYSPFDQDPDVLRMLLRRKPAIVSFHFGLPDQSAIDAIQSYGGKVITCVTNTAEARKSELAGVDAIVAQGVEAGGHRGNFDASRDDEIGLHTLVQLVRKSVNIPVIAAGGIMNGSSMRAVMSLGAIGVQLGTAFILCPESSATEVHRAKLKSHAAYQTQIVRSISGRPARGISGIFQETIEPLDLETIPDYPVAYSAAKMLNAEAKKAGNGEFSPNWAGQGAPLARELTARDMVQTLMTEFAEYEGS